MNGIRRVANFLVLSLVVRTKRAPSCGNDVSEHSLTIFPVRTLLLIRAFQTRLIPVDNPDERELIPTEGVFCRLPYGFSS
jgi:hypothetical protein